MKDSFSYQSKDTLYLVEGTASAINACISRFGRYSYHVKKLLWKVSIVLLPLIFFMLPLAEELFSSLTAGEPKSNGYYSIFVGAGYELSKIYVIVTILIVIYYFTKCIILSQRIYPLIKNGIKTINAKVYNYNNYLKVSLNKWFNKDASR